MKTKNACQVIWTTVAGAVLLITGATAKAGETECKECDDLRRQNAELEGKLEQANRTIHELTDRLAGEETSPVSCSTVDQFTKDEHVSCLTSADIRFVRVRNADTGAYGWKDTGKNGQTLPEKTDFEVAESHGFREVLKDMKDRLFWSNTPYLGYPDNAYYFSGFFGFADDNGFRGLANDSTFARCVSAAGVASRP